LEHSLKYCLIWGKNEKKRMSNIIIFSMQELI
jgi:hypothetical protein